MCILRLFVKLLLIPVWIVLAAVGAVINLAVVVYGIGRSIASVLLVVLLLAVMFIYQDWVQVAFLLVIYLILLAALYVGVLAEAILEGVRERIGEYIIS